MGQRSRNRNSKNSGNGTPVSDPNKQSKRSKQQKRTVSQFSPDSATAAFNHPDKRPVPPDTYSMMMSQVASQALSPSQTQALSPPPSQSILPQIPPYQGANGQFYTPMQSSSSPQYNMMPVQPYPGAQAQSYSMPSTPVQQNTIPAYQSPQAMPMQTAPQQPSNVNNFQQFVIDKLEAMDRRLTKLDNIEHQLSTLSQKLSNMDGRVSSLESKISAHNNQLSDIEVSRAYESQTCDEIRSEQKTINKQLKDVLASKNSMSTNQATLQSENARLSEAVIDLQSRSMRDNLLFYNFPECPSTEERYSEDCQSKVLDFCENTLEIENARLGIKIDRAHRIGRFDPAKKPRPIVVKFNYYPDKLSVKQKAKDKLDNSSFSVGDQFPKAIQDRRRKLIPVMIKAKREGKRAVLAYDKLYINNTLVTAESIPEPME